MINFLNNQLPLGWTQCGFTDISEMVMGQSPPSYTYNDSGIGLPFFQGKTEFQDLYPIIQKYCSEPKKVAKKDSILMSVRAPVGPTNVAPEDCCIGRGLAAFKPLGGISTSYLLYFMRSIERELANNGTGTTFSAINKQHIEKVRFGLPPLNEQYRIVEKIDELFSELEVGIKNLKIAIKQLNVYRISLLNKAFEGKLTQNWRKENIDKLESAKQFLECIKQKRLTCYEKELNEWSTAIAKWDNNTKKPIRPKKLKAVEGISISELSQLPTLIQPWFYIRFGEIIDSIDSGKSFRCEEREPLESEVGVAKVSSVSWGEYNQSESKTCLDSEKIVKKYFIKTGDFLMSRANTIELVGAVVIAQKISKSVMLSDKTLRISMDNILKRFVLHYLRSKTGRNEIMRRSTGNQDSMRNIGQDRIRSICIPFCSKSEIIRVTELLDEKLSIVNKQIRDIQVSLSKAEALRLSILKKAFSGQLVAQDPNEENASVLLTRILKEKNEAKGSTEIAKRSTRKQSVRTASK